jgi:hypothetical protein
LSKEVAVQRSNLTDDELLRAIAENTDAMSVLIHQQLELDAGVGAANKAIIRAKLKLSNLRTIDKYQREYRDCSAELRRRYSYWRPVPSHSIVGAG